MVQLQHRFECYYEVYGSLTDIGTISNRRRNIGKWGQNLSALIAYINKTLTFSSV
jgi:hypothetical protein